jgi:hypothetical protein
MRARHFSTLSSVHMYKYNPSQRWRAPVHTPRPKSKSQLCASFPTWHKVDIYPVPTMTCTNTYIHPGPNPNPNCVTVFRRGTRSIYTITYWKLDDNTNMIVIQKTDCTINNYWLFKYKERLQIQIAKIATYSTTDIKLEQCREPKWR